MKKVIFIFFIAQIYSLAQIEVKNLDFIKRYNLYPEAFIKVDSVIYVANQSLSENNFTTIKTNGTKSSIVGEFGDGGDLAFDIKEKDNILFIAHGGNGLTTYSVKDPLHPLKLESFPVNNNARAISVEVFNTFVYVAAQDEGLLVYSISDSSKLELINQIKFDNKVMGVKIYNNYLVVQIFYSIFESTFLFLDISDNSDIKEVAEITGGNEIAFNKNDCYLFSQNQIIVLDISSLSDIILKSIINFDFYGKKSFVSNDTLYLGTYENGLQIFDIHDIDNGNIANIGSFKMDNGIPYSTGIFVEGNNIYYSNLYQGLFFLKKGSGRVLLPDLTIKATVTSIDSNNYFYDFTVKNIGEISVDLNGDTNDYYDNCFLDNYLSSDTLYSLDDLPSYGLIIHNVYLYPGESYNSTFRAVINKDSLSNKHYLLVVIDDRDNFFESNENNNVYWIDLNSVTDIKKEIILSQTYSLSQNYPNPFNPTTTIKYSIKERGIVNLTVFDILGREVAKLGNEEKQAGSYEAKFDGSNLSSGIYFYRLQSGSFSETKKLILLK